MEVRPYLNSDGRWEEAMEVARSAVGAEVILLVRDEEDAEPPPPDGIPPEAANEMLHAGVCI